MKIFNKLKGDIGEELATRYLIKNHYKILDRNFKNSIGEIDIIAKTKDIVVFVEVKYRSTNLFGEPKEAVNIFKQQKIQKVAMCYLKLKKLEDKNIRFDVIEILDDKINHIENAF